MKLDKRLTLESALCRELGTFRSLEIPEPDSGDKWQQVRNCLFCGERHCAKINYCIGWYKCFRCRADVSASTPDITSRFGAQVGQAVSSLCRKWVSIDPDDARSYACERVLVYAGEPSEGDSDAGQLPEWEEQVKGDPDQLERYVLRALNCDLLNWGAKRARQVAREIPVRPIGDDNGTSATPTIEDLAETAANPQGIYTGDDGYAGKGDLSGYPVLQMQYADGLTIPQIAEALGKSVSTVRRMIEAEKENYLGGKPAQVPARRQPRKPLPEHYRRQRNGLWCPPGCNVCAIVRTESDILRIWMGQSHKGQAAFALAA